MTPRILATCAFFLAVLFSVAPLAAKPWDVDYSRSQLGFVGKESGTAFEGSFSKYKVQIDFDFYDLDKSHITATIDMTSATAGSADRDSYLPTADWFNSGKYPEATFVSTAIHKIRDDSYEAVGTLTIKGISQPLTLPFTLKEEGDRYRAYGKVSLLRTAFHIGEHQWSTEDEVGFGVDVIVNLAVKPRPKVFRRVLTRSAGRARAALPD